MGATGDLDHLSPQQTVLDDGRRQALVGAAVAQLTVSVVAPGVEISTLSEGEDVGPRAVGEPSDLLVAERLHQLGRERAVHVAQTQTPGTVGPEGVDLVVPGDDQRLVAEVPEDAGEPDLSRELPVQETEDGPAAELHLGQHG